MTFLSPDLLVKTKKKETTSHNSSLWVWWFYSRSTFIHFHHAKILKFTPIKLPLPNIITTKYNSDESNKTTILYSYGNNLSVGIRP